MRTAEPPINPPEDTTEECSTCGGAGDYVLHEYGKLVHDGTCDGCDGQGRVERDRGESPYLPDNWIDLI